MIRLIFLLIFLIWNVDEVKGVKDDVSGSGSDEDEIPCCNIETIIFSTGVYSIFDVLNNVTTSNTIINISTDVVLSSNVTLEGLNNITIIGQGNPTVNCNDIGSVKFVACNNVTIEGVIWERCGSTKLSAYPGVKFYNSSNIFIKDSSFYNSTGQAVVLSNMSGNVYINNCQFTHNKYHKGHGAAIYYTSSPEQSTQVQLVINNCNFTFNGPAESVVYIDNSNNKVNGHISLLQNSTFTQNQGVPIYISHTSLILNNSVSFKDNKATAGGGIYSSNSVIKFDDKCNVSFYNNLVSTNGGAIYQEANSKMIFTMNAITKFTRNSACSETNRWPHGSGGAVFSNGSLIIFQDQSIVTFNDNHVVGGWAVGGAVYAEGSIIYTNGSSTVTFSNNNAEYRGGAVYTRNDSPITFHGSSKVTFSNNNAEYGGAVYAHYSPITFHGSSTVTFSNNHASDGGAVHAYNSPITFQGNSKVIFSRSHATNGGAIGLLSNNKFRHYDTSFILFTEYCTIKFINNSATNKGGALWWRQYTGSLLLNTANFSGNSTVIFSNNTAKQGGAVCFEGKYQQKIFQSSTNVMFIHNKAIEGGAVYLSSSDIIFTDIAIVHFCNNTASLSGGAISSLNNSNIWFTGGSTINFNTNLARQHGGAISSVINTRITFSETCSVVFTSNTAMQQGGAVNTAMRHGGAVYVHDNTSVSFEGDTTVVFYHNMAESGGGALYSYNHCNITIRQYSEVMFDKNSAMEYGGAMCCDRHSDVTLEGNIPVTFTSNTAENGGAVCVSQSVMKFANNSVVMLIDNRAIGNGGAMHISDDFKAIFNQGSSIKFYHNTANRYGGALYGEVNHKGLSKLRLNTTGITFTNNRALIGDSVYLDIPTSCDEVCLNRTIFGVNKETLENGPLAGHIYTPPNKLVLGDPAVCIDDDNVTSCGTYYVNNIMLGQEIIIDACVQDYFDQPAVEKQFMMDSNDEDHTINGTNSVLISCTNGLQGINVTGSKISDITHFTMHLTSHTGTSLLDLKTILIKLIIELSPCHPGFYYDDTAQRCVCYYDDDIITCSGSASFIRRGYWFGVVNDKSTVTVCPNNYCDFTCCEATNGFYELSPVRMNQCSSHRSGTACGSCEEGYTLLFDSVECVSVDKCTTGQTVMVVTLSVIYWIAIVILVFLMTYYHVGIGYLYAITYYYSMLDILLSQNLYQSKRLFTIVTTLSSLVKFTPRFLGQLCLVKNMSGVDQQFIHYTHLLAVSVIIAIICQSARISHKFASFIGRGIIRTICFLVLMSYTSVTTTSLLLLRSLTFDNVDKVYTYLSPDIQYCHGRHLPYFIVAVLCTLVIVIGLPLILLLEPILNHKINFTRIKPLLDQFQGCYKDKYRGFAAFYMICRIVIITILSAIPSTNIFFQNLLIFSSVILAFILIYVLKPYQHKILNIFDGLILLLVVLPTLIQLINQQLSTATIIIVMILPLIFFIVLELIVHKETIKTITTKIAAHFKTKPVATTSDNNEVPMGDIGIIIDDNMRKNATICEM